MRNLENRVSGVQKVGITSLALLASANLALSDVRIAFDPSPSVVDAYILTAQVQGGQTINYGIGTTLTNGHIEKVLTGLPVNKVAKLAVRARSKEGTNIVYSTYSNSILVVNAAVGQIGVQTNSLGQAIVQDTLDKSPPLVTITNAPSLEQFLTNAIPYPKGSSQNPLLVGGNGDLLLVGSITDSNWIRNVTVSAPNSQVQYNSFDQSGGQFVTRFNLTNYSTTNITFSAQDFVDNKGTNKFVVRVLRDDVDSDNDGMSDKSEFDVGRNPYENLDHSPPVLNLIYGNSLGDYNTAYSNYPKGSSQNPFVIGKEGYLYLFGEVTDTNGVKSVDIQRPVETLEKFFSSSVEYLYTYLRFTNSSITNLSIALEDFAHNRGTNNYAVKRMSYNLDSDGDGVSDGIEFDVGRNPFNNYDASFVNIAKKESGDVYVTFSAEYRFKPVQHKILTSTNLVDWEEHTEDIFTQWNEEFMRSEGLYIDRNPQEKVKFYKPLAIPYY